MADNGKRIKKVSTDVSRETLDRGMWDTYQLGYLDAMTDLTRSQNPHAEWHYHSNVAVGETEEIPFHDVPPNQNAGGWIPFRNGFFAGVTIQITDPVTLPAGEGIRFSIYRNNIEVPAYIYVTDAHNLVDPAATALGAVRVIEFPTVPSGQYSQTERDTFQFRAGEEITVRTNTVLLPNLTFHALVKGIHFNIYWVSDVTDVDTLSARRYGGGQPGGGDDGNGDIVVM